jgi:hypothetical protein
LTHGRGFGCNAYQIFGGAQLSHYDAISLGLSIFGLGINIVLALASSEWRAMHKFIVNLGHAFGFCLIGIGLFVLFISIIPSSWGHSMWPKVLMIAGVILFVGGAIWQFTSAGNAQATVAHSAIQAGEMLMPLNNDPNHVTGMSIVGSGQGDAAAEIVSKGLPGQPSTGADIRTIVGPGQSGTGLSVTQTGPGTGLRVIQTGPGVGLRSTVIVGPNGTEHQ